MQKQKKQFIVILIFLLVLVAVFAGVRAFNQSRDEKEAEQEAAEEIIVVDLETSDITAFSYQLDGETLSFIKNGENWNYDGDSSIDLDEDKVETILSYAASLTADEAFDSEVAIEDYGLSEPSNSIVLKTAEKEIRLSIGEKNELLGGYYLQTNDSDKIYLVSSSIATQFSKTIDDLTAEEEETEETSID